jgi:hypothetical protein
MINSWRFLLYFIVLFFNFSSMVKAEESIAIMRVLDKITTRVSEVHAPVGVTVAFGTLRFVVRACHQSLPEDPPESKVLLDIWEDMPEEKDMKVVEAASSQDQLELASDVPSSEVPVQEQPKELLFSNWMFASSPASSALEHPVYDIWPLRCEALKSMEKEEGAGEVEETELGKSKQDKAL